MNSASSAKTFGSMTWVGVSSWGRKYDTGARCVVKRVAFDLWWLCLCQTVQLHCQNSLPSRCRNAVVFPVPGCVCLSHFQSGCSYQGWHAHCYDSESCYWSSNNGFPTVPRPGILPYLLMYKFSLYLTNTLTHVVNMEAYIAYPLSPSFIFLLKK